MLGELARHQPGAFEIGVENVIPFRFRVLQHRLGDDDAGIVDENAQGPEFLFGGRNGSGDAVGPSDVTGDRQAVSSRFANLSPQFSKPVDPPRREPHLGSRGGQKLREMAADPARSPGHERNLARQVEARQLGHGAISLARSRSSNFWILPVDVLGNGPKTIVRGTL